MGCMVLGLGIHIMSFNHIYCRDVALLRLYYAFCRDVALLRLYDDRDVFMSVN